MAIEMGSSSSSSLDGHAPPFYIHTKHVNTVSNKQQVIPFYKRDGPMVKATQSNTIKTDALVFVSDKKKLTCRYNYKNTRIEFSKYSRRSANYTTTLPPLLQPMYRMYFELIKMSHGEVTTASGTPRVNNINYTSYLYGICNPFSLIVCMNTNRNFINPQFFSSINLMEGQSQVKSSTQIFSSLTVNSQNFMQSTIEQLGDHLSPMRGMIEADHRLNWACCIFALKTGGFINTPNKLLLCWYNELYYVTFPRHNLTRHLRHCDWDEYASYMGQRMTSFSSDLDLSISQQLGQYEHKNPCTVHVAWKIAQCMCEGNVSDARILRSYAAFVSCDVYPQSRMELTLGLQRIFLNWAVLDGDIVFSTPDALASVRVRHGGYPDAVEANRRVLEERIGEYFRGSSVCRDC